MKKIFKVMTFTIFSLCLCLEINAKYEILWQGAPNCFVATEHGDEWYADKYYGTASVRGADRGINEDGRVVWFLWTQISYNVQGDVTVARAEASNKYNEHTVVKKVTVDDKWNFGEESTVHWNYGDEVVSDENAHSIIEDSKTE